MIPTIDAPWLVDLVGVIWAVIAIFVRVLFAPLDLLIRAFIPNFADFVTVVREWMMMSATYFSWLIDALGIPRPVLALVVAYASFALTATLAMWGIKIIAKWKSQVL